jgi:hypothetical protein
VACFVTALHNPERGIVERVEILKLAAPARRAACAEASRDELRARCRPITCLTRRVINLAE